MRLRQEQVQFLRRLARDAFVVASVLYLVLLLADVAGGGGDGRAYWLAHLPDPYEAATYGVREGFYYSPAFAQAVYPLTFVPWPVFHALVAAMSLASLYWLVGPWAFPALLFVPVAIEIHSANITLPLAVAIVVGLRYPAAWAAIFLTKVLPGVGILWFAGRAEWRSMAIALGTTAAIALVSFVAAPSLWLDWFSVLRASAAHPPSTAYAVPLAPRLVAAIVLVLVAGRTRRAWLVPVATLLATPVIWPATLSLLLAIPRLRGSWNPDRPPAEQPKGPEPRVAADDGAGTPAGSPPVPVTERTTGT